LQDGQGKQLSSDAIDTIVKLVTERLQPSPVFSTWKYYDRVQPTTINTKEDIEPAPNNYKTEIRKSDLNDTFDIKKALLKVPKEHRVKASKLIVEIEKRSPQLTFDSKGIVYIDGESIPHSNFFVFLPLLYRKRMPKTLPGFSDFLEKLNSMELKSFFILDKSYQHKRKLQNALSDEVQSTSKSKDWWLLV